MLGVSTWATNVEVDVPSHVSSKYVEDTSPVELVISIFEEVVTKNVVVVSTKA
jgi:hypothetical protein